MVKSLSVSRVPYKGRDFTKVKSLTQKYGYIPARKQIENLMLAGKRLDAYRSGLYMYNAGSMENLSVDDFASLSVPFYSTELDLAEKKAYISGVRQAMLDRLQRETDDVKRSAVVERFNVLFDAFQKSQSDVQQKDSSSAATGDDKGV